LPRVADLAEPLVTLEGLADPEAILVKGARVGEGLSELTEILVEFAADDVSLDLEAMIGKPASVSLRVEEDERRRFRGRCVEARFVGADESLERPFGHYEATLRPWPWFLTRRRGSRVFQEMKPDAILKQVFDDAGYADYRFVLSGSYELRDYCVQYGETDFDFVSRLMETEGIYYFFDHSGEREVMVLADAATAHEPVVTEAGGGVVSLAPRLNELRRVTDSVWDWTASRCATFDAVTLGDYDFASPTRRVETQRKADPKSAQIDCGYGVYPPSNDPARARRDVGHYATVCLEAHRSLRQRWRGVGNVRRLAAGDTFVPRGEGAEASGASYLVVGATHYLRNGIEFADRFMRPRFGDRLEVELEAADNYLGAFEAAPAAEPFRAPQRTPRPVVAGVQTAVVVGPEGKQLHTDEHGRVRVRFHWDPLASGETAARRRNELTCWTRVMQPWTGRDWGMVAIPRIGQEVVVQFEGGDPDRPVIIGMMYNADTMPPYALPANMTMTGVKTRSLDGGADEFNEFVMEDKPGEEYVRLQSQRDYTEIIKNNAVITIGLEHRSPGDLTQTIQNNKTETIKEGDETFTIEKGSQTIAIKTDKTETIEGKSTLTVTGNLTETVEQGNYAHKTAAGKITIEAMQSIELKVAGSSVKIDPSGVTIQGPMIKLDATAMAEVKAPMVQVDANALLILKGGLTLIN
jgi:type VI secretion system secreted protein VgrG